MGGNYEEVKMEIEKAIIAYMTSLPKKSVQTKVTSPTISMQQVKEVETSTHEIETTMQSRGAIPTIVVSPSYSFEQHVSVSSDS